MLETTNIRVIKNWAEFAALKHDWTHLLKQSDADNIFLTWEWIDCWWRTRDNVINPFIVVVQQGREILAIAPFYIQQYQLVNLLSYRALRCLGDQSSGAEYANFIVKQKDCAQLKETLWRYLLNPEVKCEWDFIWFINVSAWTKGGKTLLQSLSHVTKLKSYHRTVEFAQVPLTTLPTEILPVLSKSLRTNIRQTRRRLDKLGPWQITISQQAADIDHQLSKLFLLHNKHWQDLGGGTFQRRPELVEFYRSFVPLALAKGWLRLLQLESNGQVQAMQLGYVYNNRFLAIQEGYDPDFLSGTGQVLRHFSYQNCLKEGLDCYDFLGVYTDHKRRWLSEKKLGCNLFIYHLKIKNLLFGIKKIWPTGRYLTNK